MTITTETIMSVPALKPAWNHDGDETNRFIGQIVGPGGLAHDVYHEECNDGCNLVVRFGNEDSMNKAMPVNIVQLMATVEPRVAPWAQAFEIYEKWVDAGNPEQDIMYLADEFFTHFTRATSVGLNEEDGESGLTVTVYGLTARVTEEHIAHFLSVRHPQTWCQHEHDCCGHAYSSLPIWHYVEGTEKRAIVVKQGWHLNV